MHTNIEIDNTKLTEMLTELSQYIPEGTTDKELLEFIRLAFYIDGMAAPRADGTMLATWKFDAGFLKLLPALRAGKLSFSDIKSILQEIGVHFNAGHLLTSINNHLESICKHLDSADPVQISITLDGNPVLSSIQRR